MNHKIQTHTCTFCSKYLCCMQHISIWTLGLFIRMSILLSNIQSQQVQYGTYKAKIVLALPSLPPTPEPNAERFPSHRVLQNCEWDSLKHMWESGILLPFHRRWLWNFSCVAALLLQKRWRMFPPKISSNQEIKWLLRGGKGEAEFPLEEKETKSVFHMSWQQPSPLGCCVKGACPLPVHENSSCSCIWWGSLFCLCTRCTLRTRWSLPVVLGGWLQFLYPSQP